MHSKKHVRYSMYFCGVCLYLGLWFSPLPVLIKIAWTGLLTMWGATLLNAIFDMGD